MIQRFPIWRGTISSEITTVIRRYGARIDSHLKKLFPKSDLPELHKPIRYHLGTGGKRIRPALCLMTCEALGGKPVDAVPFAAAAEVLHNLFLLHDDIEDGDTVRRDKPATWVQFGIANALNASDYMIARAYRSILDAKLPWATRERLLAVFSKTYEKTVEGQALDINLRAEPDFTVRKYMRIVGLKTGYYLAFNFVGGAVVAGASEAVIQGLWQLGKKLGPAFQIRDDIIDLTHGKGRRGETGCDIKEGKPSILFAHALAEVGATDRRALLAVMRRPRAKTTATDVKKVIGVYEKAGSIEYAQRRADALIGNALKIIDRLPLKNKERFHSVAQFIANRKV